MKNGNDVKTHFCRRRKKSEGSKVKDFLMKKMSISEELLESIVHYFERRKLEAKEEESFGVVFAVTRYCNLNCIHCAVDARLVRKNEAVSFELSLDQIFVIIDKIHDYIRNKGFKCFLNFGGGEPTLRSDFEEILKYASNKLGAQNIGFTSNGTLSIEELVRLGKLVGTIEISLDGLESTHNSIRDPRMVSSVDNPFIKAFNIISFGLKSPILREKIQVASVTLKRNIWSLPVLAKQLREIGLKNYYIVRRAMPIGRLLTHAKEIPSWIDYFNLFIQLIKFKEEFPEFKLRMHHSLESIYSALFFGKDIYESDLPMGSGKHSIGIDWNGSVYFDPWGLVPPFNILCAGNLINEGKNLADFMDDPNGIMKLAGEIVKKNVRCKQCKMLCTGGMRFNAISHYISKFNIRNISKSHLIAGFSEIDPVCPLLYQDSKYIN